MSEGSPTRVPAGRLSSLRAGQVRAIRLAPTADGLRREVLVLRDAGGVVHAYRNLCKHLPILLDAGAREYSTPDGTQLLCQTHGARYRLDDGLCVHGPCEGEALDRVSLLIEGDRLVVLDDGR